MSTYKSASVDFDALFDPDVQGDGPTAPAYKQGGTPLKYAAIKYGQKGPDCGYKQAGVDVSNLWAKKGSAVYSHVIADPGYHPLGSTYNIQGQAGTVSATYSLKINADGTWTALASNSANPGVPVNSPWFDPTGAGVGNAYQVKFTFTATQNDGSTITNGASDWAALTQTREWRATVSGPGNAGASKFLVGDLRIQIRRASDGVVLSDTSIPGCTIGLQKF